jgi:5-methyltetrahydrofolate--homocysteine methyltransferase
MLGAAPECRTKEIMIMGILLQRLAKKKLLVSDGAWGTMLQTAGLRIGDIPEEWNASHPAEVQAVAAAYEKAGADLVLTNTFGGSRAKLEQSGLGDRVAELNEKAATLSLRGAPHCVIAASIGPTGEFMSPVGDLTADQMEALFSEQIAAIFQAGVKALCIETMSALDEACCAIRAAKKLDPTADVICTFTFSLTDKGPRTMNGVSPEQIAKICTQADVLGANCGNGVEQMIGIAAEFKKFTHKPILIHANAGLPKLVNGKALYLQTPADTSARVKDLVAAGASIVGGCCGTTPAHIAAIKAEIDKLRE